MANEKETVILDFQVNQGEAITELEKTKVSIIGLKKEQQDLNKAYKAGTITLEEYASESVRIEGVLKKQQNTYNTVQKSVTGVKTQLDKLIDSNKKVAKSFEDTANKMGKGGGIVNNISQSFTQLTTNVTESAKQTQVAGVSLGAFVNPATAAVGVLSLLGAAYARSSTGAKDLEFASNQLGFATSILTDQFASLFSSVEDGEGIVSKFINGLIEFVSPSVAAISNIAARAKEELDTINEEQALAQGDINNRLSENSELLTELANKQKTVAERTDIVLKIQDNIKKNSKEQIIFIDRQIKQLSIIRGTQEDTGDLDLQINKLIAQRSQLLSQETKGRERVKKQLNSILQAEQAERIRAELDAEKKLQAGRNRILKQGVGGQTGGVDPEAAAILKTFELIQAARQKEEKERTDFLKRQDAHFEASAKKFQETEQKKTDEARKQSDIRKLVGEQEVAAAQAYTDAAVALAGIAGEQTELYKALSIASTLISTYSSATKAYEAAFLPVPTVASPALGAAYAAAAVAQGLANVAQISGIAAAGGADFVTNKPTMLLVGDNPGGRERVTVEPLSGRGKTRTFGNGRGVAMAGGGSLTIDGGAMMNEATSQINQSMIMANMMKNMPAPEVSVKEINKVQKRVQVKENVSRIRGRKK